MKVSWNSLSKARCRLRNVCCCATSLITAELKYGDCSVAFVGGMDSYPWKKMNEVYSLKQNQRSSISDPFIRHFDSFAKFKEFVQTSQDAEYSTVVKLVERYDAQCPQLVAQLRDRLAPSKEGHCVILTTAHKSKGLEFDHVKLGDDFVDLNENLAALSEPALDDSLVEELNILYVAISRARRSLEIPAKLKRFLASRGCLIDQPRLLCKWPADFAPGTSTLLSSP
jgi:superfamily I DNA/RNA helicase